MTVNDVQTVRARRSKSRSWWADSLEGGVWLVVAAALALFIAGGGLLAVNPIDYVYAAGRAVGIIAAVLMMCQVLLVSRSPWIERAFGHDRTTATHTRIGKIAIILMLVHAGTITVVSAQYDGNTLWGQTLAFASLGWFMLLAQVGLGLFLIIIATSITMVRSRWRYENWHTVHLLTYVAIGFVVPHQFLEGTTFRGGGLAWWFWISLYVVAFGSFIVFRLVRPLVLLGRHDLRVSAVTPLPDGSTSIEMTGERLAALRPRAGQFLLWRFLDRDRWREAHPFSLSSQPHGDTLRITVKPSGDWTSRLGDVAVGTRVLAEGPLGVFSDVTRTQPGLVLISAGIGITPVRAMLEEHAADAGPCTVIVRARADDEAPLLDEVRALAAERGAALHVLIGPRGEGWAPAGQPTHLADVVDDVARCDVYVCGPEEWARAVEADALAAGVPAASIHREQFAW